MSARFDTPEPEGRYYRYSVRCDRSFNQRLDAAARKVGVSVTSLVQAHFDTILEAAAGPATSAADKVPGRSVVDPFAFARKHDLRLDAGRIFARMSAIADKDDVAQVSVAVLARRLHIRPEWARRCVTDLVDCGLIVRLAVQQGRNGSLYRLMVPS